MKKITISYGLEELILQKWPLYQSQSTGSGNSSQDPKDNFQRQKKKFSKFSRKHKRPRRVKLLLDKMSTVQGIATPHSKLYYRVIVVKAARWWNKDRHIHQWNRIEDQIKIHAIINIWFDKNPKIFSREKTPSLINGARKPGYPYVEE